MRTAVQETAPHTALRNCSKEVERWKVNTCDFGEEEVHAINLLPYKRFSASHKELMPPWRCSAFLDMKRGKDWAHKISSWKYLSKDLSRQFSWSTKCLIPALHTELLSWRVEGQQLQQCRVQSPQRQMTTALGKCLSVVDRDFLSILTLLQDLQFYSSVYSAFKYSQSWT